MSNRNTSRHRWSWRSCFAAIKYNKKSKKQQSIIKKPIINGSTHNKQIQIVNETESKIDMTISNDEYFIPTSCIIKIEPLTDEDIRLIDVDTIEQVTIDQNQCRVTHLDAIVEDSNEENSDDADEIIQPVRLICDRDIVNDSTELHSRLSDLSKMNHVKTQFDENGRFLSEFISQIDKFKIKIDDITKVSSQLPRDAELLEARYSTLLASIECLSLLLKVAQIPACRNLMNRLVSSIEERSKQLTRLAELTSNAIRQRKDLSDEDFISFRSALSSYEHLFTGSS